LRLNNQGILQLLSHIYNDTTRAYQAFQVFRLLSMILLGVVLVQSGYAKESIGDYEWFLFLASATSFFWGQGLKNGFMSYLPKLDARLHRRFIFNVFVLFVGLGVATSSILWGIGATTDWLGSVDLVLLSCFVCLGIVSSLAEHILIVKDRSKAIFFYGLVTFGIYLLGLGVMALYDMSISFLLLALVIWGGIRFLYLLVLVIKEGEWSIDTGLIAKFVFFGFPLILHVLLGGGMEYVDGFLVDNFFSREDFATFRYGARELPINTVFISALAAATIPFAVSNLTGTLSDVKERLTKLMHWLFPISIALMLMSPFLYRMVYGVGFVDSAYVFNVYLLIICSRILLPQVAIYAQHKNTILMYAALVELLVNIVFSLILMRYYGLVGIAFATVIAFLVQKVILILYTKWRLGIPLATYLNKRTYAIYSLGLYAAFGLAYYVY